MMPIIVGADANTERGVYALLALLDTSKAKEYKARLDELVKVRDEANVALIKVGEQQAANDTLSKELEARRVALEAREASYVKSAQALKEHQDALAEAETALSTKANTIQADLLKREDAVTAREQAASVREGRLTTREASVSKLESDAAALKVEYERKLAALKVITG